MASGVDAATIIGTISVFRAEVYTTIEVATIVTKTQNLGSDRGPFADSVTISTITAIPIGEIEYSHPTGMWGPFDTDSGAI